MKDHALFQGEMITNELKYIDEIYKSSSRIIGPISTKLGTNYPLVKRIPVCSNVGTHPFPRADNYEKAKKIDGIFKKFSSLVPWSQFQTNLEQSILGKGDSILFK